MAEGGDRTEAPTARRREEARKQGNIWQPRELAPAMVVATAALVVPVIGPWLWQSLAGFLAAALQVDTLPFDNGGDPVAVLARRVPIGMPLVLAAAIALAVTVAAIATSRHVALYSLAPKWSRISPVTGLQRLFSASGAAGAVTALLKIAAIAALALVIVPPLLPRLANIGDDAGGLAIIGAAIARLFGAAALLLVAVAAIDGAISFILRERKLMMSRDEVRRESRQNDGAPEVKAALRRAQMAAATRRMKTGLADAAVVVVNPVHFAVALRYRAGEDMAPLVVEKGRLEMAQAIIAAAHELKLPVIRTPRLARALFFSARRGDPVREELFTAVATILAFVVRFDDPAGEAVPPVFVPPAFDFDETGARRKPGAPLPL
jgi:flagellar biosynthetic protein FlhB